MPCLLRVDSAWLGLAVALLDRQLKVALTCQDFNTNVSAMYPCTEFHYKPYLNNSIRGKLVLCIVTIFLELVCEKCGYEYKDKNQNIPIILLHFFSYAIMTLVASSK